MSSAHKTFFGKEEVDIEQKQQRVNNVFDTVAARYDLMNDISSLFLQSGWKETMLDCLPGSMALEAPILDLASGTGDIVRRLEKRGYCNILRCDINPRMLQQAGSPAVCANAESLPFADNTFEAITIAFGLRNVTEPAKVLQEAYRVLKWGGIFVCLEFSKVAWPIFDRISHFYKHIIVPRMGQMIVGERMPYTYLAESIDQFMDQETLADMMRCEHMVHVKYTNILGGLVAIHTGCKI